MTTQNVQVKEFYEHSYGSMGFNAQRRYPNEELCRFMGRNFFKLPIEERKKCKILETGCGSGANLWMIARENFDTYGIDLSAEGVALAEQMLANYGTQAKLSVQDMCNLDFPENYFDAVVDVFSSYCLNQKQGRIYLDNVNKVLKPGSLFFSYFPCKMSDAFTYKGDATYVDADTLSGITRKDSPFVGNDYFFRFLHSKEYEQLLESCGFKIQASETLTKTYSNRQENFSFVVIEAKKL